MYKNSKPSCTKSFASILNFSYVIDPKYGTAKIRFLDFFSYHFVLMKFRKLHKLKKGDKVAIVSPSFAAPGKWPHVHELGLKRLREVFELEPVEFPSTRNLDASVEEKGQDLIDAFQDDEIKAVIASLGGDIQITYISKLPTTPFANNPKPFFGFSDNTQFANHLWLSGVPSYYGGSLFLEFAEQAKMHEMTVKYLKHALFEGGLIELGASPVFNDVGLNWDLPENLEKPRRYQNNEGWYWAGSGKVEGITWGGCLESIDDMLRANTLLPSLDQFEDIVLFTETCEDISPADYVSRVFRALGERGILEKLKALLVGRPKAWEFGKERSDEQKALYKAEQRTVILDTVRKYHPDLLIVQNLDFGHTSPQICMPMGRKIIIDSDSENISAEF